MRIYRIDFPPIDRRLCVWAKGFNVKRMQLFDGRPQEGWEEAELEVDGDRPPVRPDCPYLWGPIPVLSDRGRRALEDLLGGDVEWLPARLEGERYWLANVTNLVDGLDRERSDCEWLEGEGIIWVREYQMREAAVDGQAVFKLSDDPLDFPFVSEEVKRRAEEEGIVGLSFKLAWDSELPPGSVRFDSFLE